VGLPKFELEDGLVESFWGMDRVMSVRGREIVYHHVARFGLNFCRNRSQRGFCVVVNFHVFSVKTDLRLRNDYLSPICCRRKLRKKHSFLDPNLICVNCTYKNVGECCPNFRVCVDIDLEHEDHLCQATICILAVTQDYDEVFEDLDISHAQVDTLELVLVVDRAKRIVVEVDKAHLLLRVNFHQLARNY